MRYGGAKKRRDGNEAAIIASLRARGFSVRQTNMAGFADLIVHGPLIGVVLLEVKQAKGKLTAAQAQHRADGWPVVIVRSEAEALHACGVTQ